MTIPSLNPRAGLLATGALALALVHCGDAAEPESENPNAEACEHIELGPAVDVTAAAVSSASAPRIDNDHKRYDVTTVAVSGAQADYVGYVTFAPTAAGDYIFYTTQAVSLSVKSTGGTDAPAGSSAASIPECTSVKGRRVFALEVGTYIVGVSGAAADVSFVIEAGE